MAAMKAAICPTGNLQWAPR